MINVHDFRVRKVDATDGTKRWVVADGPDATSTRYYVNERGNINYTNFCSIYFYLSEVAAHAALQLYLNKIELDTTPKQEKTKPQCDLTKSTATVRVFGTGATRDITQGKLDYMKGLSPIVLRRYLQYLDKHRLQSDGNMRDFDNWKKGIPQETYHSSNGRHFMDTWLLAEGYTTEDNHGPVDEEDALCGLLFNTMGRLHELIKSQLNRDTVVNCKTEEKINRIKPVAGSTNEQIKSLRKPQY